MPRVTYSAAEKKAYYAKRALANKPKKKYSKSKAGGSISGSGDYRRRPVGVVRKAKLRGHGDYYFPILSGNSVSFMNKGMPSAAATNMVKGSGDYSTGSAPASNVLVNQHQIPQFSSGKMTNVVCHREYIQDIISSATPGAFNLQNFDINAGLSGTFPWLANLAANYEQYKVHGMVFEFRTMSADALNSTNTALGQVIMAVEYNSANPNFISKQQMENYEYAVSCKPSETAVCAVECARGQTPVVELYTRSAAVPANQDQRLFDLGNFQIATNGLQGASVNVGELWVTFCVELLKPKLIGGPLGYNIPTLHRRLTSAVATSNYFLSIDTPLDTIGLTFGVDTITWPSTIISGTYLIQYVVQGANTANAAGPALTYSSNCTGVPVYGNGVQPYVFSEPQTASLISMIITVAIVSITGPSAVVTFDSAVFPGTITTGDLIISQCSSQLIA